MSPKEDAENWRTIVRFRNWFKSQPFLIGVMAYALGGGSSTLIDKFSPEKVNDPRLDTLMIAVQEFRIVKGELKPLQDTVKVHGTEIAELKADNLRLAYLAPRKEEIGRRGESR